MAHTTDRPAARNPAAMLLGATGTGKTPLGEIIAARGLWGDRCLHFDFGASLRGLVGRNHPNHLFSQQEVGFLRDVLDSGALLEDEHFPLAARLLRSFMAAHGAEGRTRIVLNGLPRHVGQAEAIDRILHVDAVIHLACSSEAVFQRIESNIAGDRTERVDDDPEAIRQKLAIFNQRALPLLEHYRLRGARIETIQVTTHTTPQQVWDELQQR
jgi:adenylate kinase